jgi:prephenate dehydrogenase
MRMKFERLAVVGIGLLGGSVARAARVSGVAAQVVGVDRDPAHRERALALGIVDSASPDLGHAAGSGLVVFCTPVDVIAEQVLALAPSCPEGTLLTDVGSTKAALVHAVEGSLPSGIHFVGSHPLAGSEKGGPDHADARLFVERLTVVTRTGLTDPEALERTMSFWQTLGSRVRVMSPEDHDEALAVTSHLPHLAASALAGILPAELSGLTATGFRDATRLAAGDAQLWAAIFGQNRGALLRALGLLQGRLEEFRAALEAGDSGRILALLAEGKKVREGLSG